MGDTEDSRTKVDSSETKQKEICPGGSTAFLDASIAALEQGEADYELSLGDPMLSQESSKKRKYNDGGSVSAPLSWSGESDSQETISVSDISIERRSVEIVQQTSKMERSKRVGAFDHLLDPKECIWEPPVSPYCLIEELLYWDPWKLLVACILLNKTSGTQVRGVMWSFFRRYPTPQHLLDEKDHSNVLDLIKPLGLGKKRTTILRKFSDEYLQKEWVDPIILHGIGKYASDAYFIFCRGQWREIQPDDKKLQLYIDWLSESDGLGYGATRDPIPIPQDEWKAAALLKEQ